MLKLKRNLLSVALASATMLVAAGVQAQTVTDGAQENQSDTAQDEASTLEKVTVTGIRVGIVMARFNLNIGEGLLSAPRMMWSNLVNFLANVRAIRQVLQMGDSRRVAWDKTTHEFPAMGNPRRQPIGLRSINSLEISLIPRGHRAAPLQKLRRHGHRDHLGLLALDAGHADGAGHMVQLGIAEAALAQPQRVSRGAGGGAVRRAGGHSLR